MTIGCRSPLDDDRVRRIIRKKARTLVGKAGWTAQDQLDIEHDLFEKMSTGLYSFKPDQLPLEQFVHLLADRAACNLIRSRLTSKRKPKKVGLVVFDELQASVREASTPAWQRDQEQSEARLVFEELLRRLSPRHQMLLLLARIYTRAEIAVLLGISKSTVRGRFRAIRLQACRLFPKEFD